MGLRGASGRFTLSELTFELSRKSVTPFTSATSLLQGIPKLLNTRLSWKRPMPWHHSIGSNITTTRPTTRVDASDDPRQTPVGMTLPSALNLQRLRACSADKLERLEKGSLGICMYADAQMGIFVQLSIRGWSLTGPVINRGCRMTYGK